MPLVSNGVCLKLTLCYIKQTSNGVDLNEIREIIEVDGGKFIIVENGKPTIVVMSFQNYKNGLKLSKEEKDNVTEINSVEKPQRSLPKEGEEELKIEDLPL